jgi:hypothetical protein
VVSYAHLFLPLESKVIQKKLALFFLFQIVYGISSTEAMSKLQWILHTKEGISTP